MWRNYIGFFVGFFMTILDHNYRYLDIILYIDLIPSSTTSPPVLPSSSTTRPLVLSPSAFNCSGLAQGSYPHPTDCASFFICLDGALAGEFKCPTNDLSDPIQRDM
jgi:hypothetical protein